MLACCVHMYLFYFSTYNISLCVHKVIAFCVYIIVIPKHVNTPLLWCLLIECYPGVGDILIIWCVCGYTDSLVHGVILIVRSMVIY